MYPKTGATVLQGPPTLSGIAVLGATFARNIYLAVFDSEFPAEASKWVVSDQKPLKTEDTERKGRKTLPKLDRFFTKNLFWPFIRTPVFPGAGEGPALGAESGGALELLSLMHN
jgi:hypothetical protein